MIAEYLTNIGFRVIYSVKKLLIGGKMNIRKIEAKNNNRKKRICAYVRVSTTNGSQLDSLENQKIYFEKLYAEREDVEFLVSFVIKGFQVQSMKDLTFKLC